MDIQDAIRRLEEDIKNSDEAALEETARPLLTALQRHEIPEPLLVQIAILVKHPEFDTLKDAEANRVLGDVLSEAWQQLHAGDPTRLAEAKAEVIRFYFDSLRKAGRDGRNDVWKSTCSAFDSALLYGGSGEADDLQLMLRETRDTLAMKECRSLESASMLFIFVVSPQCLVEDLEPSPCLNPEWVIEALEQAFDKPSCLDLSACEFAVDALPAQKAMELMNTWYERTGPEGRSSLVYNLSLWAYDLAAEGAWIEVLKFAVRLCEDEDENVAQDGRRILPTLVERCVGVMERRRMAEQKQDAGQ